MIRALRASDLDDVRTILREWLPPDEVEPRCALVRDRIERHVVAEVDGVVVGIMGWEDDGIPVELVDDGERAFEIVTAYLRPSHRGCGLGRAMADEVERLAAARGFTTVLVVSGSRNRETGYPFWRARYGEPVRWDDDFFAPGAERVVWRRRH